MTLGANQKQPHRHREQMPKGKGVGWEELGDWD